MRRTGHYKLLRSINGRTAFAWTEVSVDRPGREAPLVQPSLALDCFMNWVDAAVESSEVCLRLLRARGIADDGDRIIVERVTGSAADTTDDAVQAASIIAVAAAFGLRDDFQAIFDGTWHVDWLSLRERVL